MNLYNLFLNEDVDSANEAYDRPFRGVGGAFHRGDDEHHEIDRAREQRDQSGTWYIRINGKILKARDGQPYTFRGKAAANKAALTMAAKPFNAGKEFMLTTNPVDKQQGVAEAPTSAAVRLGRAVQRVQGKTAASQARAVIPSSIPKPDAKPPVPVREDEELHIGDPVIVTGPVEFEGSTGEISDFGSGKRFVVVNLYNHGRHSFHTSDISYNDYAGSDEEEARMYDSDPDARAHGVNEQGVAEAFPNPGSGSTGSSKEDKRIAAALRKKHIPTTPNDKKEQGVAEGLLNEWADPGAPCKVCGKPHGQHRVRFNRKNPKLSFIRPDDAWSNLEMSNDEDHEYVPIKGYKPLSQKEAELVGFANLNIGPPDDIYDRINSVRQRVSRVGLKAGQLTRVKEQGVAEGWSQKYKSSINCSHPKGFSQKAHCAGKKKHNESVEMEMVCEDCGMCQTHGNVMEIKKGAKDSNGYTKCWPGKHAEGTKKGRNGGQVRNCVPNESQGVAEGGYPEVDHMPGPTIKKTQTGCKRCHGKGHVYKTPDGEVHPMNQQGAKKYKCGKCDGIGFVKVSEQGVAEGSDNTASATPAKNERGKFTAWDDDEPMRLECEDGEFRTIREINMLRQKIGMKPFAIKEQGVAEGLSQTPFTDEELVAINQYLDDDLSFQELKTYPGLIRKIATHFDITSIRGHSGEMNFYDRLVQAREEGDIPQQGVAEGSSSAQQAAIAIAKKKDIEEEKVRLDPKCWTGKHKEGTKIKGGVRVNNCVPNESVTEGRVKELGADLKSMTAAEFKAHYKMTKAEARAKLKPTATTESIQVGDGFIIECGDTAIETVVLGDYHDGILIEFDHTATFMLTDAGITLTEAEYHGRTVPLGKRMAGDVKKSKVYVKKPNGKVVKVNFGDKNMTIKKHLPKHRKSYRARHHCENPGPRWKANYWSCRAW